MWAKRGAKACYASRIPAGSDRVHVGTFHSSVVRNGDRGDGASAAMARAVPVK
jgi:hypothetical protein